MIKPTLIVIILSTFSVSNCYNMNWKSTDLETQKNFYNKHQDFSLFIDIIKQAHSSNQKVQPEKAWILKESYDNREWYDKSSSYSDWRFFKEKEITKFIEQHHPHGSSAHIIKIWKIIYLIGTGEFEINNFMPIHAAFECNDMLAIELLLSLGWDTSYLYGWNVIGKAHANYHKNPQYKNLGIICTQLFNQIESLKSIYDPQKNKTALSQLDSTLQRLNNLGVLPNFQCVHHYFRPIDYAIFHCNETNAFQTLELLIKHGAFLDGHSTINLRNTVNYWWQPKNFWTAHQLIQLLELPQDIFDKDYYSK